MNVRRFVLRLAVGLLCFAAGLASAALLGATRGAHTYAPHRVHTELIVVPHVDPPPPPRFEMPPAGPSCRGRLRARHTHEWRDVPRLEEFELNFEVPPPPPPRPRRPER
ncbi:MAG TPA: hypothetical protein VIP46_09130 [Pyrinomonadaceae bacterium]